MLKKFVRELRRREVFRAAGLYVGICWLLIEVASTVLPTFGVPEWVLRTMIIIAVAGFPVAVVLAWIYDFTDHGIVVQADATDTIVPPIGSRKMDFVVIGVLVVALMVSVYLNVTSGPEVVEELRPVSVLIADFENSTGDPVFDGSVEQALQIGLEGASFITTFPRASATQVARTLQPDSTRLTAELARLVSVREGIDVMLDGEIRTEGDGYELVIRATEGAAGEELLNANAGVDSKLEVLEAINMLTGEVREALGEEDINGEVMETFTATSIEAMQDYTTAQQLVLAGKREEALDYYEAAVEKDPDFGRALSGWALTLFNMGRAEAANLLWDQALSKMQTMTPREQYRTRGLYFMRVTGNYEKAIENYQALVDAYPADNAAHNNLAVAYHATLNFDAAQNHGRKALDVYPNNLVMQSNYALYAMYAGDFETAATEADRTLELDANRYVAWLPKAMEAVARNRMDDALEAYDRMQVLGDGGRSLANLGTADVQMLRGEYAAAIETLRAGIAFDEETGNARSLATKQIMLAAALVADSAGEAAVKAVLAEIETPGLGREVPAALVSLAIDDTETAVGIAESLGDKLQPQSRAYASMISALLA